MTPDEPTLERVAERMRAIGDPMRLRALSILRERDATVGQLTAEIGASQQNVSHHLAVLHQDGILGRRKDGRKVWYSLDDETVAAVCDAVCDSVAGAVVASDNVNEGTLR